jgi:glutamate-1-semialdehyde aminotransferase
VALATAAAALGEYRRLFDAGEYQRLERDVQSIAQVLEQGFRGAGIPCQINHLASMLQIHLGGNEVTFETAKGDDTGLLELFYLALINQGVMLSLPTSNHIYFSFAHTKEDFDLIKTKIGAVFEHYDFSWTPANGPRNKQGA